MVHTYWLNESHDVLSLYIDSSDLHQRNSFDGVYIDQGVLPGLHTSIEFNRYITLLDHGL
jgi:hypothetical protein